MLANDPKARLVDVRTEAEWSFVGIPDLSSLGKKPLFVEWTNFQKGELNPGFLDQVTKEAARTDTPLFFICRSGVRSKAAARALTQAGFRRCFNISEGFEGDKDELGRRGGVGGWRHHGLPWRQQ